MPWKEQTTMEQKVAFICEWRTGKYSLTELSKSFGISRPTAYKMIHRFEQKGMEGLLEEPKNSHYHPNQTKPEIEEAIIDLKEKYSLQSCVYYLGYYLSPTAITTFPI